MKFENTRVFNFKNAFKEINNSSDSFEGTLNYEDDSYVEEISYLWMNNENSIRSSDGRDPYEEGSNDYLIVQDKYIDWLIKEGVLHTDKYNSCADIFYIGPFDLSMGQLCLDTSNFLSHIIVSANITASLSFLNKITKINQNNFITKLLSNPITKDSFEIQDIKWDLPVFNMEPYRHDDHITDCWDDIINVCETLRKRFFEDRTNVKGYFKELQRILPQSFLTTQNWITNYKELRNFYLNRKKEVYSTEEFTFYSWIKTLPYAGELITLSS